MQNNGIIVGGDLTVTRKSQVTNAPGAAPRPPGVDVLVITALPEEHDAVRALTALSGWQEHDPGGTEPYSTAKYRGSLSVALARPTWMGGRNTATITTTLVNRLRPACLAMCGVCAGHPGRTAPGDVVVAAPAYQWDEGKHTEAGFLGDYQQFPLDQRWVRAAQDFTPTGLASHGVATDQEAQVWFLERLYRGQSPREHPARGRYFPPGTWAVRPEQYQAAGLTAWENGGWVLTRTGHSIIERILYYDVDGPQQLPFEVFAGPMASGGSVVTDPQIWNHLAIAQRAILALEMEAATIATVASERQVPHWLVAKGVMDHADPAKDDRFKPFAARASAEVLFALLGTLLPGAAQPPPPATPAITIPGKVKLEVLRRLAYDWPDLADYVGIPSYAVRRFRAGDEPREVWAWLESRGRLAELPEALTGIGRDDVAGLVHPYL